MEVEGLGGFYNRWVPKFVHSHKKVLLGNHNFEQYKSKYKIRLPLVVKPGTLINLQSPIHD